jgi:hypothetical protein
LKNEVDAMFIRMDHEKLLILNDMKELEEFADD